MTINVISALEQIPVKQNVKTSFHVLENMCPTVLRSEEMS